MHQERLANAALPSAHRTRREESAGMFRFGFGQYMQHAFPRDDLRPISCRGKDSQGGIALTLIDSLDTLIVSGGPYLDASIGIPGALESWGPQTLLPVNLHTRSTCQSCLRSMPSAASPV